MLKTIGVRFNLGGEQTVVTRILKFMEGVVRIDNTAELIIRNDQLGSQIPGGRADQGGGDAGTITFNGIRITKKIGYGNKLVLVIIAEAEQGGVILLRPLLFPFIT